MIIQKRKVYYIEEEQIEEVKKEAEKQNVTESKIIRELINNMKKLLIAVAITALFTMPVSAMVEPVDNPVDRDPVVVAPTPAPAPQPEERRSSGGSSRRHRISNSTVAQMEYIRQLQTIVALLIQLRDLKAQIMFKG